MVQFWKFLLFNVSSKMSFQVVPQSLLHDIMLAGAHWKRAQYLFGRCCFVTINCFRVVSFFFFHVYGMCACVHYIKKRMKALLRLCKGDAEAVIFTVICLQCLQVYRLLILLILEGTVIKYKNFENEKNSLQKCCSSIPIWRLQLFIQKTMRQAGKEQISSAQTSDVRDGQFAYCCHLKDIFSWKKKKCHNCEYADLSLHARLEMHVVGSCFQFVTSTLNFPFWNWLIMFIAFIYVQS